jgi:hypothetical protein
VRRTYALIILALVGTAIIGSMLANVRYTQHIADVTERRQAELRIQSDQRWCALFALLDPAEQPTTDRGRTIQTQLRFLQAAFHCVEVPR